MEKLTAHKARGLTALCVGKQRRCRSRCHNQTAFLALIQSWCEDFNRSLL